MINKEKLCCIHSDEENFEKYINMLLLYRKIVSVKQLNDQTAELTLDNGVKLIAQGNDGCYGCNNGWYYLEELNGCDNAITKVEAVDDGETYNLFVFADNQKINCLQYEGYDNGYYGTGYSITVFKVTEGGN